MGSGGMDRGSDGDRSGAIADRIDAEAEEAEQAAAGLLLRHRGVSRVAAAAGSVWRHQSAEQVSLAASGAAFWLVISAFPTAIAVVSLFGLVVDPGQVAHDLGSLARAAPSSLGSLITDQLRRVAAADQAGLSAGLVVSVIVAVWSASGGVYNLDRAIRYSFGLPRQRYVEARTRAIAGACAVVVLLGALALGAAVVGGQAPRLVITVAGVPSALLALTAGIATMYRFSIGPIVPVRQLLPGAAWAAAAVVVLLAAFAGYLAVSSRYTAVYGAFAGLVIGMISVYLAVYAVLLGAVLSAQLRKS